MIFPILSDISWCFHWNFHSGSCLSQLLPLSTRGYHGILLIYVFGGCQLSCYKMIQHVDAQTRNLGKTSGKHHPGHLGTTLGATNNWEWPTTISTYGQQNITASRGVTSKKGDYGQQKSGHIANMRDPAQLLIYCSRDKQIFFISIVYSLYSQTVLSP